LANECSIRCRRKPTHKQTHTYAGKRTCAHRAYTPTIRTGAHIPRERDGRRASRQAHTRAHLVSCCPAPPPTLGQRYRISKRPPLEISGKPFCGRRRDRAILAGTRRVLEGYSRALWEYCGGTVRMLRGYCGGTPGVLTGV
jgi:hypothetical protein